MATSRRTFLKNTIAGASVALGDLRRLASPPDPPPGAGRVDGRAEGQDVAEQASPPPEYTRGVGVYPGDPRGDFGPALAPDTSGLYRNLALDADPRAKKPRIAVEVFNVAPPSQRRNRMFRTA